MPTNHRVNLSEIFKVFLKLGVVAFGGPAAHVAIMHQEFVEKRQWMSADRFTTLLGITNLIPGPNSTEMAMLCGYEKGGIRGFLVAGSAFIFPSMTMTMALAAVYVHYGELPQIAPVLLGLQAGVVVVILHAVYKLAKKSIKNTTHYVLLGIIILLNLFLLDEISAILLAGVLFVLWTSNLKSDKSMALIPFLFSLKASVSIPTSSVFLFFLKIGAVLFGSGYVLVAYLDRYLVEDLGWLTRPELLDAIAIGQFTPGPVLTTASFIGYLLNGIPGGLAATLGIFLPSFVFVGVVFPLIEKLQRYGFIRTFIYGAGIGALAVMAVVAYELIAEGVQNHIFLGILIVAFIYQFGYKKANSIITIILSMLAAYILSLML